MDFLSKSEFGQTRCDDVTSQRTVDFASELVRTGKTSTVTGYLSGLSAVMDVAKPTWGYQLDKHAMANVMAVVQRLGLIARSYEREQRPTLEELDRLMPHLGWGLNQVHSLTTATGAMADKKFCASRSYLSRSVASILVCRKGVR